MRIERRFCGECGCILVAAAGVAAFLVPLATGGFGTALRLPFLAFSAGADGVDRGSGRFLLSGTLLIFPSVTSADQLNQERILTVVRIS